VSAPAFSLSSLPGFFRNVAGMEGIGFGCD
jgi:hypothetical protein